MSDQHATTTAGLNPGNPDCDKIRDLIAPLVLGVSEPAERRLVEHHLRSCGRCARALTEQLRTVNLLPFMAPAAAPSPAVKTALFAEIEQSRQARESERSAAPASWTWSPPAERTETLPASRLPYQPVPQAVLIGERGGLFRVRPIWTAISAPFIVVPLALILIVTGGWAGMLRNQMTDQKDEIQTLQARLETMNGLVTEPDGTVYAYNMVAGPADVAREAFGKFMVNAETGQGMMMVENLDPESTYHIWGMNADDQPVRMGDLVIDSNGSGRQVLDLNGLLQDYLSFHVTSQSLDVVDGSDPNTWDALSVNVEPRGLSSGPTGSDTNSRAPIGGPLGSGAIVLANPTRAP